MERISSGIAHEDLPELYRAQVIETVFNRADFPPGKEEEALTGISKSFDFLVRVRRFRNAPIEWTLTAGELMRNYFPWLPPGTPDNVIEELIKAVNGESIIGRSDFAAGGPET